MNSSSVAVMGFLLLFLLAATASSSTIAMTLPAVSAAAFNL